MKLTDLKPGDRLVADGGFTCIRKGAVLEVKRDPTLGAELGPEHQLWVACAAGMHFLDGQVGDYGELVGLARAANGVRTPPGTQVGR